MFGLPYESLLCLLWLGVLCLCFMFIELKEVILYYRVARCVEIMSFLLFTCDFKIVACFFRLGCVEKHINFGL